MSWAGCILIGYLFGSLLTAELVARCAVGKPCAEIGSGNPGMANILHELGFWPGAAVLAGDILKTAAACGLCAALFGGLGRAAVLYAGLGAALGHDFPMGRGLRGGGKGVAVTCAAIAFYSPLWGTLADAAGMLVVFSTGWLPVGAVVIPAVFVPLAFWLGGAPAGLTAAALLALMLLRHRDGLARVRAGTEPRRAQLFGRKKPAAPEPEQGAGERAAQSADRSAGQGPESNKKA
jgi:glycerol-3-phosphate acyltransferase PlsY